MLGKTKQIAEDLNKIQDCILKKVDKVANKIKDLKQKQQELENNTDGHSEKWVNEQKSKIQKKIDVLDSKSQEFKDENMKVAQKWMSTQKDAADEKVNGVNGAAASVAKGAIAKITDAIPKEEEESEDNDETTSENNQQ